MTDKFDPRITNSERALIGLPLLVKLVRCCPPHLVDHCAFSVHLGMTCVLDEVERADYGYSRYLISSACGTFVRHRVFKIEVLP